MNILYDFFDIVELFIVLMLLTNCVNILACRQNNF